MKTKFLRSTSLVAGLFLLAGAASSLHAQATRTWVSGVGDDANPCSRTAPCKTFAGTISKTAVGGEINVIDPGAFGAVTITKSITIDGGGGFTAGILHTGTFGVTVNDVSSGAPNTAVVVLRNLDINGTASTTGVGGTYGVRFISGKSLIIENCTISNSTGSPGNGVEFAPNPAAAAATQLFINNTTINNCNGGVLVKPGANATAKATLEKVELHGNGFGFRTEDRTQVVVRDSVSSNNNTNGFICVTANVAAGELTLDNCLTTGNGTNGVKSETALATVRLNNVTIVDNNTGLTSASGGVIATFGNNHNSGNSPGGNGAPTQGVTSPQ